VRDARRVSGGQRRLGPARQQWLATAARSARKTAMRGLKECSRCPVRSDVLKVAMPYVGPCEGARWCVSPEEKQHVVAGDDEDARWCVSPEEGEGGVAAACGAASMTTSLKRKMG
jgi:hypothetical protein